ncbi:hypothetical protein BpHYR1_011021 [Brachionus plicatilis]|uniref:Uncharacterized protein n=1 Tax=Brachionus plicatilis TaxID=10195 RepID=A0A3M7P4T2_BRAPC|nr:hypothetical protein BpHYR1_011021 [Brachionus plicatilis]
MHFHNGKKFSFFKAARITTYLVPELKSKPYLERREALGWTTLEERRRRGDLIQLHKIQHGHDRVELIHGYQLLASNLLDSPASGTRRVQMSIERQLVRNCGVQVNYKYQLAIYSGASTCTTTWRLKRFLAYSLSSNKIIEFFRHDFESLLPHSILEFKPFCL